jgi:hypothetical protein
MQCERDPLFHVLPRGDGPKRKDKGETGAFAGFDAAGLGGRDGQNLAPRGVDGSWAVAFFVASVVLCGISRLTG